MFKGFRTLKMKNETLSKYTAKLCPPIAESTVTGIREINMRSMSLLKHCEKTIRVI